ncbi:MAG: PBP1A family penicillin-binding protein [Hyphomonadaceae bacterium]|nr:PBP1A family penicillin-binding protein [Hyphomonadaceae bacterium]
MADPHDPNASAPPPQDPARSGGPAPDDGDWRLEDRRSNSTFADLQAMAANGWRTFLRYFLASGGVIQDCLGYAWRLLRAAFASTGRGIAGGVRGILSWRPGQGRNRPVTWRRAAIWAGWTAGAMSVAVVGFLMFIFMGMPSTDDLWTAKDSPSITIQDRYGRVLLREEAQNAPPVNIDTLPAHVGQAVIAIEDKRFYDHMGVDLEGLTRAVMQNAKQGRVVQGGSTITQQLAKNLFLTNERTLRRKLQEVAMALWLESKFTKKQILALYLSRVYFGASAWGIEAASERYFDKPARDLTLGESALLAGLLKAPSRMNPANEDTLAKARALVVLNEMVAEGFITPAQRDAAADSKLPINRRNPAGNLGYFRDWIDRTLNSIIGDQRDDFIVETTLDLEAQRAGEASLNRTLDEQGETMGVSQGGLISLDAQGGVRAMVGGRGYTDSQFNRTTQARRQPGSAFKYFIYLTAMERPTISPWSVRVDAPITIGDWSPGNYEDEYYGPVTMTQAFARSMNMVAISVANEVGHDNIIDTARRLGVRTRLHNYRSLALGAQELPMIEMAQAYAAMASGGFRVEPHGVTRVRRASGNVIWSWRPANTERVIDDRTLRSMNLLMNRVVEAGTGTRARIQGRQIGGKTGTGNDYRDAWFVGFTSGITTAVWVGNDNYAMTKKVTGGSLPATIWRDYMVVALRDAPPTPLAMPKQEDYMPEPLPADMAAHNPNAVDVSGAPLIPTGSPKQEIEDRPSLDGPEG